jgi:hypothetical protein
MYSSIRPSPSTLDVGVGGQHHAPTALPPEGKTRYLFYRRLGGSSGAGLDRCGKSRPPLPQPEFDPRTFQPVASRYTD